MKRFSKVVKNNQSLGFISSVTALVAKGSYQSKYNGSRIGSLTGFIGMWNRDEVSLSMISFPFRLISSPLRAVPGGWNVEGDYFLVVYFLVNFPSDLLMPSRTSVWRNRAGDMPSIFFTAVTY